MPRPSKLPDDTVNELVREHQSGDISSYAEATDRANEKLGDPVSYTTVRRRMHDVEDSGAAGKSHQEQESSDSPSGGNIDDRTAATRQSHVDPDNSNNSGQDMSGLPGRKKLPDDTVEELARERREGEIGSSYNEAHTKANEMLEEPVS
ncbi:hypothetical protein BG004_002114 [Podila humilis]|nr:hypothetical protein BG004_002114 [Podila humilis]